MRTVSVKLLADTANYSRNIRGAATDTKHLVGELDRASKAGNLDHVTNAATGLGIGLLGVAGVAVKFSMDFEKQMSSVQAATHGSSAEIQALRQASLQAGKDTQFSATQAAQGVEELAKAGVSTADILGGGLKGALSLAAAGGLDVGEAAETAASALTQFKLRGSDVPHVADLLAAAAGKAQGSVQDMGAALNQAGLVAASTGLSIEDTTGTLAAFASAGLIGSDAGTSFKTMLQALQAPSGKTRDLMDELGISAYDAQGQFVGITALAQQLRDKLGGLTPELRANAMAQIFGSDAVRAANVLYEQGASGIQGWIDKTNDAGYAAETAAMKTDNLAGDVERLKGSLETQAIESGGGLNQGLRVLTKSADALVGSIGALPSGVTSTITVMAALGGTLTLAGVAWLKARTSIAAVIAELNAVGPAGAKAAVGLQAATKWAGRAAVAFIGLEVAGAIFDKLGNSAVNVDRLTAALEDYATTGKMTQGLTDEFGKNLDDFSLIAQSAEAATHGFWGGLNDLTSSIPGVSSAVDSMNEALTGTSFNDATERMKGLDQSFTAFIATQKDAKRAGEIWNQLLVKSGLDTQQLAELLPNAWKGLGELQKAAHGGAGAQGELAGKTQQTAEAMEQAQKKAKELQDAFDQLFGAQMSIDRATLKYRDGVEALTKELKSGQKTLKLNTEEGRKNRTAVLDQIDTINDLRQSRIAHGWTLDAANKKYVKDIDGLRASMRQAGFTKDEVNALTGAYKKIPGKVGTNIETPGLPKADKDIKNYDKRLDGLARDVKTKIGTTGEPEARKKLERLLVLQQAAKKGISVSAAQSAFNKNAYATGGWTGPGGTWDEAGVVHADEFVVKKPSRRRFEQENPGVLDHINTFGEMPPGYAGGGLVMPFPYNVSGTKVMSTAEALSKVTPAVPAGGRTDDFIVRVVKAAFPGLDWISKYRPGAHTLSGNRSYHSMHRAVDWPASRPLAEWWNLHYKSRTKEFISPWNDLNIWNGRRHTYTGAIYRQHNFAGGNAHDHIAMAGGGVINEPVYGYGASGRSYSFGENGAETVVPGLLPPAPAAAPMTVVVQAGDGADMAITNTLLANILAATRRVGGEVAGALVAGTARTVQTSRAYGRAGVR